MAANRNPAGVTVLGYHRISPRPLPSGTWVGPGQLARQLDALRDAGIHFVSPDQYLGALSAPDAGPAAGAASGAPPPAVLVTFDDATSDLHAYRNILQERGIRPLVFTPVACLGRWNTWEWPIPGRRVRHLTPAQLCELADAGWEIGLHGATHRDLTGLGTQELVREIDQARRDLESITGRAVRCFSYPYGRTTPRVAERVRAAGFSAAFVLAASDSAGGRADRFRLPRRPVYCIDGPGDVLAKVRDPFGETWFGRWQRFKERGAHGVGRWTAACLSRGSRR